MVGATPVSHILKFAMHGLLFPNSAQLHYNTSSTWGCQPPTEIFSHSFSILVLNTLLPLYIPSGLRLLWHIRRIHPHWTTSGHITAEEETKANSVSPDAPWERAPAPCQVCTHVYPPTQTLPRRGARARGSALLPIPSTCCQGHSLLVSMLEFCGCNPEYQLARQRTSFYNLPYVLSS